MRDVLFFSLVLLLCACSGKQNTEYLEIIPIKVNKVSTDVSSFIEKMEIVPLETNDSSLFKSYQKMVYSQELDLYAILDNNYNVYLFSGDGKFVSSSEKVRGEGPGEYQLIVDMKFNPYLKTIDLLNPYGRIYSYDKLFNLVSLKDLEQKEEVFTHFMPISKDKYLFSPPPTRDAGNIYMADLTQKKTKKMNYDNVILSIINMDRETFYDINGQFYFIPKGINYYCYQVDTIKQELIPIIKFDFGKEEIEESTLPGAGRNEAEKASELFAKQMDERRFYLEESDHYLPLIKFFNDDFAYVYFIKHRKSSCFIYNRKTGESFLRRQDNPLRMPFHFAIQDNVLLSIADPYDMSKYINENLMSKEDIAKVEALKDDDNPVIIKYYLER